MLIHQQDTPEKSATACWVLIVDTDVIVTIVGKLHLLEQVYAARLVRVMALFNFNTVAGLRLTHKFSVCIDPSSGVEEEEVSTGCMMKFKTAIINASVALSLTLCNLPSHNFRWRDLRHCAQIGLMLLQTSPHPCLV